MAIKYRTKFTKVKITELKKKLYESLLECDISGVEGEEGERRFFIYHGIKVTKYADRYSVKVYEQPATGKERYIEVDNPFIIHLLIESVPTEIIVTT